MDHKTAGLMLYALQTASINLRNATFEVDDATNVVIDRDDVHRTCIKGPQWFEEDFSAAARADEDNAEVDAEDGEEADEEADEEDGEEDGEEVEDDAEHKNVVVVRQVEAAAGKKEVADVRPVTAEEARKQVQGVVRNWLLEVAGEKAAVKPG
jgi:hypothetical protein